MAKARLEDEPQSLERLEEAIAYVAWGMIEYKMPQIRPTLERLIAARDKLRRDGNALDFASRILADSGKALPAQLRSKADTKGSTDSGGPTS